MPRRSPLGRWTRRDRLAVVAVAATVALLTGAVVLATAVAAGGTALAEEYRPSAAAAWHESPSAARGAAPPDALVVPVARATTPDGSSVVVAGIPPEAAAFRNRTGVALPARPPGGATLGTATAARSVRLAGPAGTAALRVRPRGPSAVPPSWYVASPATVRRLGPEGALVLRPARRPVPADGAAVPGALGFLVAGGREVARGLGVVAVAAAVLVAVTVHGTTRATVVDRRATLGVLRATGATRRRLLGAVAARAAGLTAAGVAVGYAVGVVAVHAAENVAAAAGVATALSVGVGPRAAGLLVPAYAAICVLGAAAGAAAAWPALRRPPARLFGPSRTDAGRWPAALAPALLDRRAAAPTASAVAAFAAVALLVGAGVAAAGPAVTGDGAVVAEPGAAHPVASTVPAGYATALRDRGIPASGEVVVLAAVDGRPVLVRGARFGAFANVSGARIRAGRAPAGPGEAVVGVDLARTLGVDVGDALAVGGTTRPRVARVRVVGTFAASGATDDGVVVTLGTARHLAAKPPGTVQFVRTGRVPRVADAGGPVVVGVSAPRRVVAGETVEAAVTLVNPAATERTRTVEVTLGGASATRSVRLAGGARRTVTVDLPAGPPGRREVAAGATTTPVRVVPADALDLAGLPARAPPGSAPRVVVVDARGRPVPGARVTVGDRTRRTGPDGTARVPLSDEGTARIVARAGNRSAVATVRVSSGTRRVPAASVRVEPARPTPLTRPVAAVAVSNPWNVTLARTVTVEGPSGRTSRDVRLAPGEAATLEVRLPRQPTGDYRVAVHSGGRELAERSYAVAGGDRLVAAASTRARRGGVVGAGVGPAVTAAVGDLRMVAGALVALAGLAALGATLATFAATVRARRPALGVHLAVGARPGRLLRTVVADALRVGTPAAVAGVAAGAVAVRALDAAGVLVVYGVSVSPRPGLAALAGLAAAGTLLAVLAALLAAATLLRRSPGALLDGSRAAPPGGDDRE